MSEGLTSSTTSFKMKLGQIISQEKLMDRSTDVVCTYCWSLVENITKHQHELQNMIEEVNTRLESSFKEIIDVNEGTTRKEDNQQVCLILIFPGCTNE